MEDDTAAIPATIGGRDAITKAMHKLVVKRIFNLMELFNMQVRMADEARRIKEAMLKPQLSNSAEHIPAIVNTERPNTPATLCGLVRNETVSNTSQMECEIQLLKSQMENLVSGKSKKKNPPIQHPKKGNHTSSIASAKSVKGVDNDKVATRKKQVTHLHVGGGNNATTIASKNKSSNPS